LKIQTVYSTYNQVDAVVKRRGHCDHYPMTILFVLLAMAAIASVGLAAAGRLGALPAAHSDHRPAGTAGDPTFDVVLRGYRMDEVDAVIEDLQRQLNERRDQT